MFGKNYLISSFLNIYDNKNINFLQLCILNDLHRRICDRLNFRSLRVFSEVKCFAETIALYCESVQVEFRYLKLLADDERLGREKE